MKQTIMLALATTFFLPAPIQAQESGRYQLERGTDGFVRLDTQTGAVSLCREKDGTLTCRMAADERTAYEDELARLERRIAALETRAAFAPVRPTTPPSDEEIDRTLGIMERFMRSFFGMVQEFEGRDSQTTPLPDRS